MRVGVLGGTFDPIHIGHLVIAEEARVRLELAQVIFIPTGQPWLKGEQPVASAEHRFNMVRLAVASNLYFRAAGNEIDRPGPTYTVDTLAELREELGRAAELYFILGRDALGQFHRWQDPERVLELCNLVIVSRPGYHESGLEGLLARYPQAASLLAALPSPSIDVSGTDIRRRAAGGISFRYQVPDAVAQYIREHRLYQADPGGAAGCGPEGADETTRGRPSEQYS